MGKAMGIDFGRRRIGVAVSDLSRTIAFPREVLTHGGNFQRAAKEIARLVSKDGVDLVVVGMPLEMDGGRGRQAELVSSFIGLLAKKLAGIAEVTEWDERLSSVQAERVMTEAGVGSRQQKGSVDKVAAAIILQAHLDCSASAGPDDQENDPKGEPT